MVCVSREWCVSPEEDAPQDRVCLQLRVRCRLRVLAPHRGFEAAVAAHHVQHQPAQLAHLPPPRREMRFNYRDERSGMSRWNGTCETEMSDDCKIHGFVSPSMPYQLLSLGLVLPLPVRPLNITESRHLQRSTKRG